MPRYAVNKIAGDNNSMKQNKKNIKHIILPLEVNNK